jgi:hypothetical protein
MEKKMSNLNQGKRKDQIEYSEKVAAGSMIAMIIIMFIGWVISTL